MAIECANQIKAYCEAMETCEDCVFRDKTNVYVLSGCGLRQDRPEFWEFDK